MVAAAFRDGEPLWVGSFGLSSLEFGVPNQPHTRFNAGSVAKQFTATAILKLEQAGRLRLDDPVRRYVPELPAVARRITLRQMLHHTSGLRDVWALTDLGGWQPADVRTPTQAMRILARQRALNFPPGTGFGYSNSGYLLLAEVIRRITDRPFPDWMREHVLEPAGMSNSYFYDDPVQLLPGVASAYRYLGRSRGFVSDDLASGLAGSGNLVTTVTDLGRWSTHLQAATVGGATLVERLSEQATLPDGRKTGYGLGLFIGTYRGLPVISHGGANAGFRSHLMIFTGQRMAMAVLGNVNTVDAERLARSLADVVLEEDLTAPDPRPEAAPVSLAVPFESFAGRYVLGELLLEVRESNKALYLGIGGGNLRRLTATGPETFTTSEPDVSLKFRLDEKGSIAGVELLAAGRTLTAERLEHELLTPTDAREYEGVYYSEDLDTSYRIVHEDGHLVARHLRGSDIVLEAFGRDKFLESAGGDLRVDFQRSRRGRITGFEMSVDRARAIAFGRI